ncbi:MAG: chorismate synthase [Bacteroidetes bacterium]|nr:chorismate synthase [Bacteroidota bacterium]
MGGNSIGKILVLTTFGESHGACTGGVLDGFPSDFPCDLHFIQSELNRRAPGFGDFSSPRKEEDRIEILSGIFEGKSTGAPIAFIIPNKDHRSEDYSGVKDIFRPSHADYAWEQKFGHRDYRGGGRISARETAARVAGGAFARMFLISKGIKIHALVCEIGGFKFPAEEAAANDYLKALKEAGDTAGGIIQCVISGLPAGLGEPVFDKLQASLARAMMSINAVKGFEYGSGFKGAKMKGSEHNDSFIVSEDGSFRTSTNFSGGIQGGISNGMPVEFRVAFKPVSSILQPQETIDKQGRPVQYTGGGRHDVCVVPRAVPIVEAMAALVIADHILVNRES